MGRGRCDCWGAKSPTGINIAGATKPFGHGGCTIPSSSFAVVFESFVEEEAGGWRWFFSLLGPLRFLIVLPEFPHLLTSFLVFVEAERAKTQTAEDIVQVVLVSSGRDRDRDCRGAVRDDEATTGTFKARNFGHRFNEV